jgi:hypothetical protein
MHRPEGSSTTRSWFGDAAFLAFVVAQVSDGLLTYLGIIAFGIGIEANPLVAWYAGSYGIGVSIVSIKLFAITCGAVLHLNAMHRTLSALTLVYAAVAVWPWTRVLASV